MTDDIIQMGALSFPISAAVKAAVLLLAIFASMWFLRRLVERARGRVGESRAGAIYVGGQVARYLIIVAGAAGIVSTLGIDLSALSLFAGALGVGIGLGLQDVIRNFVCGLILMFEGSVEVGDYVELEDGTAGRVVAIGPRAVTLLTADEVDILVPNMALLGGKLTNWTRNQASRRIHIPFSVAYGSDKELVRKAAVEAAHAVSFTMAETKNRTTQVWLVGFGASALDFELVVWPNLQAVKRPGSMMAAYNWALDDALARHGIEIPFNQLDLRLRRWFGAEGETARQAWHGKLPLSPESDRAVSAGDSRNDAAGDAVRPS